MKRTLALAAAALTLGAGQVQAQQPLAFVACPTLRDTATVPCWLADYRGELYFLGAQDDPAATNPPALGHEALIEGTPTETRRCGGKVLVNLHVSILPERALSCDAILPATDAFPAGDIDKDRPPANAATPAAAAAKAPETPPRAGSQRFEVLYDFDWQTAWRDTQVIQEAAAYAKANPKAEVHVSGYRASVKLTGGKVLAEEDDIGMRRARELTETLAMLGVDRKTMLIVDHGAPDLGDHTRRRATIDIVMAGGDEPESEH